MNDDHAWRWRRCYYKHPWQARCTRTAGVGREYCSLHQAEIDEAQNNTTLTPDPKPTESDGEG